MATNANSSSVIFVNSTETVERALHLLTRSVDSTLYIDLEGINLSRNGSISLLTIFVESLNTTALFDIHTLRASAFTTPYINLQGVYTLKSILENPNIKKAFFDVRNDSDALFTHYGIALQGIIDLQLHELACRPGDVYHKRFVSGLSRCIQNDLSLSTLHKREWQSCKDAGCKLFAPEKGGRYEVFNERPLRKELETYCVSDVTLLPALQGVYQKRMDGLPVTSRAKWRLRIESATLERVKESHSQGYVPNGRHKAKGPWMTEV